MHRIRRVQTAVLLAGSGAILLIAGFGAIIILILLYSSSVPLWLPLFLGVGYLLAIGALADLLRRLYSTIH